MNTAQRSTDVRQPPAAAIRGTAAGLFMMAFFTSLWAGIAYGGWHESGLRFIPVIFIIAVIYFVSQGIRILGLAKNYPDVKSAEDRAEGKRMGKWFGIIFGAEGLFIFLAVNLLIHFGHPELIIPAIALVVGLHFYPMGWMFRRTIDYYLASWATAIAVLAIIFAMNRILSQPAVLAFTGLGMAAATTAYGIYMLSYAKKLGI
ncbi:MAG TPA: hypothetical protein VG890_00175 [Puia sp.]|nr:hypothetical protein [Puia sp.]